VVRLRVIRRISLELTAHAAADMLGITPPQAFRVKTRYRTIGPAGLDHGSRGRQPANARPMTLRHRVLKLFRERLTQYKRPTSPRR
jgi:hypothetical protein